MAGSDITLPQPTHLAKPPFLTPSSESRVRSEIFEYSDGTFDFRVECSDRPGKLERNC